MLNPHKMLDPEKDPPTHTAWSKHHVHGKFREWYKRGDAWVETNPQGQVIFACFEATPAPRGCDGFIWAFPKAMGTPPAPPPPPEQSHRPGTRRTAEAAEDEE